MAKTLTDDCGAASSDGHRCQGREPHLHAPGARSIVRGALPRLVETALIPLVITVTGAALLGFWGAALAGAAWMGGLIVWKLARRRPVPTLLIWGLAGLSVRLIATWLMGDTTLYFMQPAVISSAVGVAFLGSAAAGRPVIRAIAVDFWPELGHFAQHHAVIPAFRGLSVVWGSTQILFGLFTATVALALDPAQAIAWRAVCGPVLSGTAVACSIIWMWVALRRAGLLRRAHECAS